jgi:hypothetical protein
MSDLAGFYGAVQTVTGCADALDRATRKKAPLYKDSAGQLASEVTAQHERGIRNGSGFVRSRLLRHVRQQMLPE